MSKPTREQIENAGLEELNILLRPMIAPEYFFPTFDPEAVWAVTDHLEANACNIALEFVAAAGEWACRIESWNKYATRSEGRSSHAVMPVALLRAALLWWTNQEE